MSVNDIARRLRADDTYEANAILDQFITVSVTITTLARHKDYDSLRNNMLKFATRYSSFVADVNLQQKINDLCHSKAARNTASDNRILGLGKMPKADIDNAIAQKANMIYLIVTGQEKRIELGCLNPVNATLIQSSLQIQVAESDRPDTTENATAPAATYLATGKIESPPSPKQHSPKHKFFRFGRSRSSPRTPENGSPRELHESSSGSLSDLSSNALTPRSTISTAPPSADSTPRADEVSLPSRSSHNS